MTTPEQDQYRAIAIQCVAELASALDTLHADVIGDAGWRNIRGDLDRMRTLLTTVQDTTQRDGRWRHWKDATP